MSFARRDWFSEAAILSEAASACKGSAAAAAAGASSFAADASDTSRASISQGCMGAAKSMARIPVKAGSAAATQARKGKEGRVMWRLIPRGTYDCSRQIYLRSCLFFSMFFYFFPFSCILFRRDNSNKTYTVLIKSV